VTTGTDMPAAASDRRLIGRTRRYLAILLALALPVAIAACGKKGPLRLPEEPATTAPPASPAPGAVPEADPIEEETR